MKVGSKVRFTSAEEREAYPRFFPPIGTVGTICGIDTFGNLDVQWPKGTTSGNDRWWAVEKWVEEVEE